MRLHNITITPRSVTLDGLPLTVHENGPNWEHLGEGAHIVHIPVIARTAIISGDTHDPDEPTPIYDQTLRSAINASIETRCGREKHPADWRTWSNK